MKKRFSILALLALMALSSCHKSTCPTFDDKVAAKTKKGSTGKSKLSIFPKGMNK